MMKRKKGSLQENMISHIRRERKIKQIDLAQALDVSPSYLCKIEKGLQEPTDKFIKSCADYLSMDEKELFPAVFDRAVEVAPEPSPANRLWTIRREKGIKQYQLAKMLECSPSYLSKVEKGVQKPNDRFRKRCAKILKVKETILFPETD